MERQKGLAYCGLACCVCSENSRCAGCRQEGCKDKEGCGPFRCCRERGIDGCWQCPEFPCGDPMLQKRRVRVFAQCIGEYGEKQVMDRLERNAQQGMQNHYPGRLVGDYDQPETDEGIRDMLMNGCKRGRGGAPR